MKPRQTRIKKVVTSLSPEPQYIAQHKGWFFWYNFDDFDAYNPFTHTSPFIYLIHGEKTLDKAKKEIDNYIEAFNKKEAHRNRKTISVDYIKYP